MELSGKVVIVTGASYGIGAATSRLLAARGAKVVLAARSEDALRKLEAELAGSHAVIMDVTKDGDIERLIETAVAHYGAIDGLINNAGQGLHVPIEQIKLDDYRAIMELNVYAPLALMQAVTPVMRKQGGGAIVNISSGTTKMVIPGLAGYASSKAALNFLSQTARIELAPDNIVVSLIYPYITLTDFHTNLRATTPRPYDRTGLPPGHTAEYVAEHIVRCLETGETEVSLVPERR